MSEHELIERARAGDGQAFATLVATGETVTRRLIARVLWRVPDLTDDAWQEALLKAYIGLRGFRGQARFSTWLARIAMHEALLVLRKNRRAPVSLEEAGVEFWPSHEPGPEHLTLARELRERLEAAVSGLGQNEPLARAYLRGDSYEQMAAQFGAYVGTLKARMSRKVYPVLYAALGTNRLRNFRGVAQLG